jgi:hypothetical protein
LSSLIVPPSAIRFSIFAKDDEILAVASDWAEALAAEDYKRAYGMTAHDPYYAWSPELTQQVIEGYGLPEKHPAGPYKVTPPKDARGGRQPRHELDRYEKPAPDGAIGTVLFDLPLNNQWSNLTATFRIYPTCNELVACLNEIHVF